MPKLTVTHRGRVIGKRTTDRPYAHVVAMLDFDAAAVTARIPADWANYLPQVISSIAYNRERAAVGAGGTIHVTTTARPWSYELKAEDHAKHVAWLGDLSDVQIMVRERDAYYARAAANCDYLARRGDCVLSWHGNHQLAAKALAAAAAGKHPGYRLDVLPVDGR